MVFMMVPIWAEDWSIFLVAAVSCSILALASAAKPVARSTSSLALPQRTALVCIREVMEVTFVIRPSTEAACSAVPLASSWAPEDTISALASTWPATWEMSRMTFTRLLWMDLRLSERALKSPI